MIRIGYRQDDSYSGDRPRWIGLLRVAGTVLVECGHAHINRDDSSATAGEAARVCARMILAGARRPAVAAGRAEQMRNAWARLAGDAGFAAPASVIEKAKVESADRATAYLALVDQVRAHPDLNTTAPRRAQPKIETAEIGEMPDWML